MTARVVDHNGWFTVPRNPLSKAGIYNYSGKQINAPDPNKTYRVLRSAKELSRSETVSSFKLVPFIDNHAMLGSKIPGAIPAEKKGVHGVTGDNIVFDARDKTLYGNLKVFSDSQHQKIDDGKIDISLGYLAKYDFTPGVDPDFGTYDAIQYDILGNHAANVDAGRMGSEVAVLDEATLFTTTFDAKDIETVAINQIWIDAYLNRHFTAPKKDKDGKIIAESIAVMDAALVAAGTPTVEDTIALLTAMGPRINSLVATVDAKADAKDGDDDDDMETVMDAAGKPVMDAAGKPMMQKKKAVVAAMDTATMDAAIAAAVTKAIAPLNTELTALKAKVPDMKTLMVEAGKRDNLAAKLSHFVGVFDHAEMSVTEVAKYAIKKLEIPTVDGQEVVTVEAWLHGRTPPKAAYAIGTIDAKEAGSTDINAYLAA